MYKLIHIVGARPNFMKLAPVYKALQQYPEFHQVVIHTGQHFDFNMTDIFFREFSLPVPEINLKVQGKTVLEQISLGIARLEEVLPTLAPDLVIIYGDINATAYASIVCSKLGIKLAHVEAGLRSFDRTMPEETNRIVADALSDYFFTPSEDGDENLVREGKDPSTIFRVGNVMIDTLIRFLPDAKNLKLDIEIPETYGLVTLHRPSNVDDKANLISIINLLQEISQTLPLVFPVHPRTKQNIPKELLNAGSAIHFIEPLGYLAFLKIQSNAVLVLTDSGGIQEETTYLGIPCFTLRNNTERPITVSVGTNTLVGTDLNNVKRHLLDFLNGSRKSATIPELWDGNASNRIANKLSEILHQNRELKSI